MQSESENTSSNQNADMISNINRLQQEYYEKNNKNIFFKKNQKYDCANIITQNINVQQLFEKTLFVLNHNSTESEIYFDYTVFKTYIHPGIFDEFLDYINYISFNYIEKMEKYILHLNFQHITISAFERYCPLVKRIMQTFPVDAIKMQKTYIYYTPSVIDQMMKVMHPFISHFRDKIVFYTKMESPEKINGLILSYNNNNNNA